MKGPEAISELRVGIDIAATPEAIRVSTSSYELIFPHDASCADLYDARGDKWVRFHHAINIDTDIAADNTLTLEGVDIYTELDGTVVMTQTSLGGNGQIKQASWRCHDDFIEYTVTATGYHGRLERIRLGGGRMVMPKQTGDALSERYFQSVFNCQPSDSERRMTPASEATRNTVHGAWRAGEKREFLNTPPVFAFSKRQPNSYGDVVKGPYLTASISAPLERQLFHTVAYDACEDGFCFDIIYDCSEPLDDATLTSPSLLLHFDTDVSNSLGTYIRHAQEIKHLPTYSPPTARLGRTGMRLVEWGANDERARALTEQGHPTSAAELINVQTVRNDITTWKQRGVPVGSVTLDDKWQQNYGTNTPDLQKFPDMNGFISELHEENIQVGLWTPAYEVEGLPDDLCIVDDWGRPISGDPSSHTYLQAVADQAEYMISPDGLDADFLKIDFTANLPHGPGIHWHGDLRGNAAQHAYLNAIYSRVKRVKPSGILQTQFANPWFSDVMDELRLNDAKEHGRVVRDMAYRAMLGRIFLPEHPIDPDGWPIRNKKYLMQYVAQQPKLAGTVTMHYVDRIGDNTFSRRDIAAVRRAVRSTIQK